MSEMCPCGIEFELEDNNEQDFEIEDSSDAEFVPGDAVINMVADYNSLLNKPQINHVVLMGNLQLMDLFPDGIIIDGGSASE